MALEPVSAVISITATSLILTRKTLEFIQEARDFGKDIHDLLVLLNALKEEIKAVKLRLNRGNVLHAVQSVPAILEVPAFLTKCEGKIAEVEKIVIELAARKSDTFMHKAALAFKIQPALSKKDAEKGIKYVERLMDRVHKLIQLGTSEDTVVSSPVISEIPQEGLSSSTAMVELHPAVEDTHRRPPQIEWEPRDADNSVFFDPYAELFAPRPSASSYTPRPSVSTTLSDETSSPRERKDSGTAQVDPDCEWVDFYSQLSICQGNMSVINNIRKALELHPEYAVSINCGGHTPPHVACGGRTPLHVAAQYGNIELARVLINRPADINAKDSEPASVLDLAVAGNHDDFVGFLIEQGVDETGEASLKPTNRRKLEEIKEEIELAMASAAKEGKTRKASFTFERPLRNKKPRLRP